MNWDDRNIAKIFNSNVLNDIANGDFSFLEKIASENFTNSLDITIREFYDRAYNYLSDRYRNEYFYKNLIVNKILIGRHSLKTATMLSEFRVGFNKADCIILNGRSTCYEIKTDYDSLIRLEDQLNSYLQIFDEVYVVCSSKYLDSVLKIAPIEVGILQLTDRKTFKELRKAKYRSIPINKTLLMQSLRQNEYIELAERVCGNKIISPNTLIYKKCFSVINSFEDDFVLNRNLINILKKTRKNNDVLVNGLPKSLANAAISYKFKKTEIDSLIGFFKEGGLNVLSNIKG